MKENNKKVAELYFKRKEAIDKDFVDFLSGVAVNDQKEFDEISKYCDEYDWTYSKKMMDYTHTTFNNAFKQNGRA